MPSRPRKTHFVSVNMTVPARDALQQAALRTSADVGLRLSMSSVLLAALTVAEAHPDEWHTAITAPNGADE